MGKRKQQRRVAGAQRAEPKAPVSAIKVLAEADPARRVVVRSVLGRLHDLSERVGKSLRHSADQRVRLTASLLVVGSLALFTAACDEATEVPTDDTAGGEVVYGPTQELTAEVAEGLPAGLGQSYQVKPDTITRDDRGVYHLDWLDPQTNEYRTAAVSNLQLVQSPDDKTTLQMGQKGDAVLAMPADVPVTLVWPVAESLDATPGPGTPTVTPTGTPGAQRAYLSGYPPYYSHGYHSAPWFALGYLTGSSTSRVDPSASRPAYRDPPSGQALESGQPLRGSVASDSPKPFGERTVKSVYVSGMSKGTGAGRAVTGKTAGASSVTGAASGKSSGTSGVKAPSSSGFSIGKGSSSSGASS